MNKLLQAFPAKEVLDYWFGETLADAAALAVQAPRWFTGGPEVDKEIVMRFGHYFDTIAMLDVEDFERPEQLLAAVILLDQFSRNCFRGQAKAFAYDVYALDLLDFALEQAWDTKLHPLQRAFLYMPLQHIEAIDGQNFGVELFTALAEEAPSGYENVLRGNAEYAKEHRDLIAKFGRFPHRNNVLGRDNTPDEKRYLDDGGKRFGQ